MTSKEGAAWTHNIALHLTGSPFWFSRDTSSWIRRNDTNGFRAWLPAFGR
jgi:hypothetical protein